jgi:uncharacterized membrane protein YsdA (DUF1294 family)
VIIGYDKKQAIKQKRRVSERTLLTLVVIGGTIASGIAMLTFRHKTAKRSYLLKFFGIMLLQIFLISLLFYFESTLL